MARARRFLRIGACGLNAPVEYSLLMSRLRSRCQTRFTTARGNALVPVLIIFVALAASAAVFFLYTRKHIVPAPDAPGPGAGGVPVSSPANPPANPSPDPAPGVPAVDKPAAAAPVEPKPPTFGFARPADVAQQLARSLNKTDMAEAAKLITAASPEQEATTRAALDKIQSMGFKAAAPDQVQIIGQIENAMRLSVPLAKADGSPTDARLLLDVQKDPKMGWKISSVQLPQELEKALADVPMSAPGAPTAAAAGTPAALPATAAKTPDGLPVPPMPGTSGVPAAPPTSATGTPSILTRAKAPDALTFANDFVRALIDLDYNTARKFVDEERIPAVKLAGLCIVFEDGQYKLQPNRPLMATIATESTSWIIAKVHSDLRKEETEFGLEMAKEGEGWRIVSLNLSQLLADSTKSSSTMGVPYTPLVKNPKGGESIALYYEYDSATLHPRAQSQLKIVAEILKASPNKKLKIGGHTDAMGTVDYNLSLSKKRADAVKKFFLDQGVPVSQVQTIAFGKQEPLAPDVNPDGTDNPEGRSKNRRAEILLDF